MPGLLAAVARNRNRGFEDVALFEIGQGYRGDTAKDQFIAASGVRAGTAQLGGHGRHWRDATKASDLYDVKADVAALLASLGLDIAKAQITRDAPSWFHPGRSGVIRLGPKLVLAHFGELHPATAKILDVTGAITAFEVFVSDFPGEKRRSRAKPKLDLQNLLPVRRDFAFVVDATTSASDVIKAALGADKALVSAVEVFDVYADKMIGAEKKSLAIQVTLQPPEKTLTEQEIDTVAAKIIAEVKRTTGGEIRS